MTYHQTNIRVTLYKLHQHLFVTCISYKRNLHDYRYLCECGVSLRPPRIFPKWHPVLLSPNHLRFRYIITKNNLNRLHYY